MSEPFEHPAAEVAESTRSRAGDAATARRVRDSVPTSGPNPELSVVVSARNDDYGGDFVGRLTRMLLALDAAASTLPRPSVLEVVVVDWNVVPDQPPLRDVLPAPEHLSLRVVEVPHEIHVRVAEESGRQLLEGNAKNVGVLRARGARILITNADIMIRSDILRFCLRVPLGDHTFVRADRYDFRTDGARAGESPEAGVFVAHVRHGFSTEDRVALQVERGAAERAWPRSRRLRGEVGSSVIWGRRGGLRRHFLRGAHTNAAGDFLCVSKASFLAVGGVVEDPYVWMHGDGLLVAQLLGASLRQVIYSKPGVVLHGDHWRASDEERFGGAAVWPGFLERIQNVVDGRCSPRLNPAGFGLEHEDLAEYTVT